MSMGRERTRIGFGIIRDCHPDFASASSLIAGRKASSKNAPILNWRPRGRAIRRSSSIGCLLGGPLVVMLALGAAARMAERGLRAHDRRDHPPLPGLGVVVHAAMTRRVLWRYD